MNQRNECRNERTNKQTNENSIVQELNYLNDKTINRLSKQTNKQ